MNGEVFCIQLCCDLLHDRIVFGGINIGFCLNTYHKAQEGEDGQIRAPAASATRRPM